MSAQSRSVRKRRTIRTAYALLAPSFVGIGLFLLVPLVIVIVLSLFSWDLISAPRWAGLANYEYLFTDSAFGNSLLVTVIFTVLSIPTAIVAGFFIAVLINRKLPGSGVFKVLYVLPWVSAPLALGVVWKWIFAPSDGLLNAILGVRVEWLTDLGLALPAVAAVQVWSTAGYISLFFLAGLQTIPASIYEAARLDGTHAGKILWHITIPLLRPTTFFVTLTSVIASFQVFDTVYALTGGGPRGRTDVIANRIYQTAFVDLHLGRASAMAVVLLVILVIVAVVQQRWFRGRITYDMS